MAFLELDRNLLHGCLSRTPRAWERFVDRFLGLVLHVIRHTAQSRSVPLSKQDEEDLAAWFFEAVVRDNFALLRRFRGGSSLATYLAVVARRLVVRELLKRDAKSGASGPSPRVQKRLPASPPAFRNRKVLQ